MHEQNIKIQCHSPLSELMEKFIHEKQACGYRYQRESHELLRLDRFLCKIGLQSPELPRDIVDKWTAKQVYEKPSNQRLRIIRIRQFALYLRRQGIDAYVPETTKAAVKHIEFTPYIFNHQQVGNILRAADSTPPDSRSPMRHLIMPEVFRVLYCCGMRVSEVLHLKFSDVNLAAGILTIRKSKFNKDRLVPLAPTMTARLRKYASVLGEGDSSSVFFSKADGKPYSRGMVYYFFRQLLWKCSIPHGGRGKGPRLHDLRHSFAVHRLESWYRQGADLGVKLPFLAAYMGHKNLISTQWYLHLTPEIFPNIVTRLEQFAGHVIPRRLEQ
jgi:integrase/recombinase XerD